MSAYVPVDLQRRIRAHFSDCCAYCRTVEKLTVAVFELEHIIPRSAGGKTVFENLCLACPTCNRFKANRTAAWDLSTQESVPLFHPQLERWSDHSLCLERRCHGDRRLDSNRPGDHRSSQDEPSATRPRAADVGRHGGTPSGA